MDACCWGSEGTGDVELADIDGMLTVILVSGNTLSKIELHHSLEDPREIPPPGEGPCSPNESPRRSFSNELPP